MSFPVDEKEAKAENAENDIETEVQNEKKRKEKQKTKKKEKNNLIQWIIQIESRASWAESKRTRHQQGKNIVEKNPRLKKLG